jgi:opacity protein-like surface antigen
MRLLIAAAIAVLLAAGAHAKDNKGNKNPNEGKIGPIKYHKQETDTGRTVEKQYQVDVNKKKNVFIYGGSKTTYPAERNPGQNYHATNPSKKPDTSYGVGVGIRFGKP